MMAMKKNEELNNQEVLDNKDQQPQEQQDQLQQVEKEQKKIEMDIDQLKQWIVTDEGKRFLQPILDRHFSKGLKTWQENNLEKLVNEEVERRFPTDPKEKEILKLKNELKAKEISEVAVNTLAEHQLPPTLARFFIGESVEDTKTGLEEFINTFKQTVNKEIKERLKPFGSVPRTAPIQRMTPEEIAKLDYHERVMLYQQNPDEYRRIMNG